MLLIYCLLLLPLFVKALPLVSLICYAVLSVLNTVLSANSDSDVMFCFQSYQAGPRSAVGNVSGYRCVSDCRSRGREFDPGPVPYFRGD